MPSKFNLIGNRFGMLIVIREGFLKKQASWVCKCDCGIEKEILQCHLRSGHTISCGCYNLIKIGVQMYKHGASANYVKSPEYSAWSQMKARCTRKTHPEYKNYGARGIKVCSRWMSSFNNFISDMGNRPTPYHSLDRFPDINGDYTPQNCRWATDEQQNNNKRDNVYVNIDGMRLTYAQCARRLKIRPGLLRYHIVNGKPIDWIKERARKLNNNRQ